MERERKENGEMKGRKREERKREERRVNIEELGWGTESEKQRSKSYNEPNKDYHPHQRVTLR